MESALRPLVNSNVVVTVAPPSARCLEDAPVEIVERKGRGHPDTLCDGVADGLSIALARRYRQEAGTLLHFNLDKLLLAAGQVERGFGWGRIVRPITVYVGDRATTHLDGRDLGIPELVEATAREWFARTLPNLDVERGLRIVPVLAAGSAELSHMFRARGAAVANDTSAAVGYAPLTPLERAVLALEEHLQAATFKARFPQSGEDVKVMAVRRATHVDVTVAMPFLAQRVTDAPAYADLRRAVEVDARENLRSLLPERFTSSLVLNALDDLSRGSEGVYLTLSGTSAEHGDSGEVGRGNRASGLISFMRPGGAEAAAGKNPRSHVGKIYSVLAFRLAEELRAAVADIAHATVWLVSKIGTPVTEPHLVHVEVIAAPGARADALSAPIEELVSRRLRSLEDLCTDLERGAARLF